MCHGPLTFEAAPEEIRHLDEESPFVAAQPGFELAGERIETAAVHVVIVAYVKSRAGIRRPAKEELPLYV